MTERKTSSGMASLLSEKTWAIPEEKRKEMLYELLNRITPCNVCRRSTLRLRGLGESIYYSCSENLAPREGCLLFDLDKGRVIVGNDIVNEQVLKEDQL